MSNKPMVIILKDTVARSLIKTAGVFVMICGIIGLGVYLQSSAMQWAGFVLSALVIAGLTSHLHKDNRLTIAQARAKLDELEKGGAA